MSLDAILNSAVSSLSAMQTAMQVTAANVGNVNTEGYGRKVVALETIVLDGQAVGVEIAEIRRIVDQFVDAEYRVANADANRYQAIAKLHDQIQSLLGDPADNLSLTGRIDDVFSSLSTLAMEPKSIPRRIDTVAELAALADEFSQLAGLSQSLRTEAERRVGADIMIANAALDRISDLNLQIAGLDPAGAASSGLKDQRAQTLDKLSAIIDIRISEQSSGAVTVSTLSGLLLVDGTPRRLVYSPSGTVAAGSAFNQITVNTYDPITGIADPTGSALDPDLMSGSLRGWLDMRDQVLPELAVELGELAARLIDELNRIHNDNVAVPPPTTLTGRQTGLAAGDLHGFSGQAAFYTFDANNDVVNQVTVDFDAIGPTLANAIAAVDAVLGAGTLTLNNGVLKMTATGGATGVGIQQITADPAARAGRGFSHFFGLNDLLGADVASHFDTGFTAGETHNLTGTINLRFIGPANQVPLDVTVDFGAIGANFAGIETNLDTQFSGFADFAFGANGELTMTAAAGYETYRLHIVNDTSDRGGTGLSFGALFGVGDRFAMNQAKDVAVRADIAAAPSLIALAKVDAAGSPALTMADNRGAQQFQELALQNVSFAAAGDLPAARMTIGGYAAQLLGNIGAKAARAESASVDREALRMELANRRSEVQGVNLDEEMAQMIIFQNAYNAAARLIQTTQEMFEVLTSL